MKPSFLIRICLLAVAVAAPAAAQDAPGWVAVWAASPQAPNPSLPLAKENGQTLRQRFRVTVGGPALRVRLSNQFGDAPLTVGAASVAAPTDEATVRPGSLKALSFLGSSTVVLAAGASVLSDPVAFATAPGDEVAVSLYLPIQRAAPTQHALGLTSAVITPPGDFTRDAHVEAAATTGSSILVSAILVPAAKAQRLLVALGDSITDGDGDGIDADHTWPADFARRLRQTARPGEPLLAVVNEGIGGNRLLHDQNGVRALDRFDSDVLALPGVTHVMVLEGINDIGWPGVRFNGLVAADPARAPSARDIIGAYRNLIARAHAHGIKIVGGTLTPFEGTTYPGYYSDAKEAKRQAVNRWIRTSRAFDGVVDFDAALRDPQHPGRMQSRYASPDHLHPNSAGYQAMADVVDERLFK